MNNFLVTIPRCRIICASGRIRKGGIVKCVYCGNDKKIAWAEIKRQVKNGRKDFFCSLSCSSKYAANFPKVIEKQKQAMKKLQSMRPGVKVSKCVRQRANHTVRMAIRNGRLIRPLVCDSCHQRKDTIDAHHEDYDFPLEVEWLCRSCHNKRHMKKAV